MMNAVWYFFLARPIIPSYLQWNMLVLYITNMYYHPTLKKSDDSKTAEATISIVPTGLQLNQPT